MATQQWWQTPALAPSPAAARARQSSPRDRCLRCRTPIQNLNATVARCEGRTFRPHRIHSSPQMQPRCPPCHCHCRCHCCCFPPHYHCHLQTAPHAHTCTRTCTRMHAYTKMKNNEDRKPRWSRVGGGGASASQLERWTAPQLLPRALVGIRLRPPLRADARPDR